MDPYILKKGEKKEEDFGVKDEGSQHRDRGGFAMAAPVEPMPMAEVKIGSVHPERDFEHWLAQRTGGVDTVTPAIEQMCKVICRFAEEGEDFHGKALSCLATLRRGCVREGEAASYNEFLRRLRLGLTRQQAQLWKQASKDMGLCLISDAEVVTSTVSTAEAHAFHEGRDIATASARATASHVEGTSGAPTALSEKDLEAMIE